MMLYWAMKISMDNNLSHLVSTQSCKIDSWLEATVRKTKAKTRTFEDSIDVLSPSMFSSRVGDQVSGFDMSRFKCHQPQAENFFKMLPSPSLKNWKLSN